MAAQLTPVRRRVRRLHLGIRKNFTTVETGQAPATCVIVTYPARVHRSALPLPLTGRSTPNLFDEGVD